MNRNKIKLHLALVILAIIGVSSCTYNSEEDLYPVTGCQTDDLSYTNDILPIIQSNCYVCHDAASNFGNINLEGHDNLKVRVDDGSLLGSINHEDGWAAMPSGNPKLLDCQIEKISTWVDLGAPNN